MEDDYGTDFVALDDKEISVDFNKLRSDRREKARKNFSERGIEVMLLFQEPNIRYVSRGTGRTVTERATGFRYCLFEKNSNPILFEFGMLYHYTKQNNPWLDVRPAISFLGMGPQEARENQLRKFAEQIKSALKEKGVEKETLALDVVEPRIVKALNDIGIKTSFDAMDAMSSARAIKTREEVQLLRVGSAISEAGFSSAMKLLRGSVTESELKGAIVNEMYRRGMEIVATAEVASGPRIGKSNISTTSNRLIRPQDMVIINTCSSSFSGYRICYYRTFSPGPVSKEATDAYEIAKDMLYQAINDVRPGMTTGKVVERWQKAEEFGYPNEDTAFWLEWGHGIGLTIAEGPTFTHLWSKEYPETLKEGMTIALETWYPTKKDGKGQSVRIEEMLRITDTGCEVISKWPIDEISH